MSALTLNFETITKNQSRKFAGKQYAVVTIDCPNASQNTLSPNEIRSINSLLDQIEAASPIGLIFISTKSGSFVAGANIDALSDKNAAQVSEIAASGQAVFDRIEKLKMPTVAAIHGNCLGAGLELAMSCTYRLASDDQSTKLGLPEIKIGLLPGAGGTERLPKLVGLPEALKMMLRGSMLPAKIAKKKQLVDFVTPAGKNSAHLLKAAIELIVKQPKPRHCPWQKRFINLSLKPYAAKFIFNQTHKTLQKQPASDHYPAIQKLLDVVEFSLREGSDVGGANAASEFGELSATSTSKALRYLFHASRKSTERVAGKIHDEHIWVLGGGLMGAGIASVTATKANLPVIIKERDAKSAGLAKNNVQRGILPAVKRADKFTQNCLKNRVHTTHRFDGIDHADCVIEAVFEDITLKHDILREIESKVSTECLIASNTSSIPITKLAEIAKHPERVVGMHYFSPVEKMPLLEIIKTEMSTDAAIQKAIAIGKAQGKTVIVVGDGPGFYTTRILAPYLNEAGRLLLEGYRIQDIDRIMTKFGFAVGPLKLIDEVGLDVAMKICPVLTEAFGDRMAAPKTLETMLQHKCWGRKTGSGFYQYKKGKKSTVNQTLYKLLALPTPKDTLNDADEANIRDRLFYTMIAEAIRVYQDGLLESEAAGDIGAIMGLGFPPQLGGPFYYLRENRKLVQKTMMDLAKKYGATFEIDWEKTK